MSLTFRKHFHKNLPNIALCWVSTGGYDKQQTYLRLIAVSFFLHSLSCCLWLIPWLQTSGSSIPRLHSLAVLLLGPVPPPWRCSLVRFLRLGGAPRSLPRPRRCSCPVPSLALAVLLLGPFLGLGGAPARSLPWPWRCSCSVPSLASVVLLTYRRSTRR
jgi:hypothetical protein